MGLFSRLKNAWNTFIDSETKYNKSYGYSSTYRPDRKFFTGGNERSIISSVYNRISVDCASIKIRHVRLDENKRFVEEINSDLNECLTYSANVDQTGRELIQDTVESLFDEGYIAIVPVDTTGNIWNNNSYDILSLRVGKIITWYPEHVQVELYNEKTGHRENVILPKSETAIVTNPFYAIMNERNSTLQRLIKKLNILDAIDEQSGSGKLDLIIQLPYVVKTQARQDQAEQRRKDIENQLANSKFGIAYTDGTEKITQLNRSVENNLMKQIEYLTNLLFSQLGITQAILDGTANSETMLNYTNRTVEPVMSAITDEMNRKFLTKTARSQNQHIMFFSEPFKLVPIGKLAEIADKFTRNEILTSNEVRQLIGMKPSDNPEADELRNKNLNKVDNPVSEPENIVPTENVEEQNNVEEAENQNG